MPVARLANDATASSAGLPYQLYVVLQKCFELPAHHKVFVEKYGDVTVSAREQVETKHYAEPLTDSHENFWKTLANWVQAGFDDTFYASLVLYTTQRLGKRCRLVGWNLTSPDDRLLILESIHNEAERRYAVSLGRPLPAALSFQRQVLAPAARPKLERIVGKFTLCCRSPDLVDLYTRICTEHCKGILQSKRTDFLNSLLGFVISPEVLTADAWEISCAQFTARVEELTSQFCHDTRIFPAKYLRAQPSADDVRSSEDRLFVQKIRNIEHHEVIPEAIRDYIAATRTVLEEFRSHSIPPSRMEDFERDVCNMFSLMHRRALRKVSGDIVSASQEFYDDVMLQAPPDFPGFGRPELAFRNGVLHACCDKPTGGLKWRLERP